MSSAERTRFSLLENQAFAMMSRMHVSLRRHSGYVSDIQYMRIDLSYCRYLINMARAVPNEDLQQVCARLEEIFFGPEGLFVRAPPSLPLLDRLAAAEPEAQPLSTDPARSLPEGTADGHSAADDAADRVYIGRLR